MQEDTNMLTKIGVAALLGTIGTAAVGGTASAQEWRRPEPVRVTVAAPAPIVPVAYGYGYGTPGVYYRHDRRDVRRLERERAERQRLERERAAREHAMWLRTHGGHVYGRR
jgi:hypothetical protein